MLLLLIMFVLFGAELFAQECDLCTAVNKDDFKRIEKIFKKKLLERKYGYLVTNENTTYTAYNNVYNNLVIWLMQKECVELAAWDKCQTKIQLYPSYATLGVIFKTQNKPVEVTFHVREGHPSIMKHRLNARERLYFLGMKNGDGFVENQISLCNKEKKTVVIDSVSSKNKPKHKNAVPVTIQKFNGTIDYKSLLGQYFCVGYNDTIVLKEIGNPATSVIMERSDIEEYWFPLVAEGKIKQIGVYSPWHIQIVGIRILQNGDLEAHFSGSYLFEDTSTLKLTYRKIISE